MCPTLRTAELALAVRDVSQLSHRGFAASAGHLIQGILITKDRSRFFFEVLLRRQFLDSSDLRDHRQGIVMSIRTGNRSRHNRKKKQFARNRVRIRLVRAALIEASAAAAKPVAESK
jgi:glutamate synthase domain-containing protein 1